MRSRGKEIAENLCSKSNSGILQANGKKIHAVFSHNDQMTLGFLEILSKYRIKSGQDITIVSIDAEQAAIDALKNKKINSIVECNPKMGVQVMEYVKMLANNKPIPSVTYVPETVFTENDNLAEIKARGY